MKGVGIDGCRGGWLAAWAGNGAMGLPEATLLATSAFCCQGCPTPMPDPPERDRAGLSMAIWHHDFNHC